MGLSGARELRPWHIMRRTSAHEIKNYAEIYPGYSMRRGELLRRDTCVHNGDAQASSSAITFKRVAPEPAVADTASTRLAHSA